MNEITKLLAGYERFYERNFAQGSSDRYQQLSRGQSPKTLIITCSDSRVSPLTITGSDAGDIFVVRNVANLVPPYQPDPDSLHGVSAALEYGVCHLNVEHIIVMGHSGCGGIQALREGISIPKGQEFSFIAPWVKIAETIHDCTSQTESEKAAIAVSLRNLETFPWIRSRVEQNTLHLHGWYFRIEDGQLLTLKDDQFTAI